VTIGDTQVGEHETKFVFPNNRASIVRSWLREKCVPDPEFAEGLVSSIYFDTRDFELLGEKLNSFFLKTKVRLRWYSSFADKAPFPITFLEVKKKVGSARIKKRVKMTFSSDWVLSQSLENPVYLTINSYLRENHVLLKRTLYPAFQLNYRRTRYVDPLTGARLSVDSDIYVSRVNRSMVNGACVLPLTEAVFEYKEKTGFLPDWLNQVNVLGECKKGAFSKYSECYARIHHIFY
jgi:SPX domain protein involved in polyphosphate accumulation